MRCTQPIRRSAQLCPQKTATICGDRVKTFAESKDRISRLAGALQVSGIKEGDRVAILSLNSDRYYESYFAIPWSGAVAVPLNIRWTVQEHIYALNDSAATMLFVDDAFYSIVGEIVSGIDADIRIIYMGDGNTPEGASDFEALITEARPVSDAGRGKDDLFGIFYTGGTTGFPKGVMISHSNYYSSSMALMAEMNICQGEVRYMHVAPMFHMADAAISMANTISGNTHVFIPAFNPAQIVEQIQARSVTDVLLVPTMIAMLLEDGCLERANIDSLKKVIYGASPMTEGTLTAALRVLQGVQFYQAYGQTELAPVATVLRPEYHVLQGERAGKIRSAGQASLILELKIVDADGNECDANDIGEVLVSGPNAMLGYWNNPEQTQQALQDGWVHTGDAGYVDNDGFLFLVDRVKDMIVTGGENVYSAEVENVVSQHPAVLQVAVIGIPDAQWGEAVHAVIRLKADVQFDEEEFYRFCRADLASYKCPRSIDIIDGPLPTTSVGKISKKDLRQPYWQGVGRNV